MKKNHKIFVAGHNGMVGSAILRKLKKEKYTNLLTIDKTQLDLRNEVAVKTFFETNKPEYVFLAAAKVGGIKANSLYPVEFLLYNLMIQNNIIKECYEHGVKRVIFLGSSCIYPKNCLQPMKEEYLFTGILEPTNEAYALAKISGIKLLEYYHKEYLLNSLNVIPCNLYGTNDNFDADKSHVLSALVKKFVDAKDNNSLIVKIWGSGLAKREFMHVDDLADALFYILERWPGPEIINVGVGEEISIKELASLIAYKVEYKANIEFDTSMPDGMLNKCMDISKLKSLGYQPKITLSEGIDRLITEYQGKKRGTK